MAFVRYGIRRLFLHRLALLFLAIFMLSTAPARTQTVIRFDAFALPLFVLSGDGLAPVLAHTGFAIGGGAELRAGPWIPLRAQIDYFHIFPSVISSAGDLYRSWAGWELSLAAGARILQKISGRPFSLDLLGGFSFGADHYPGTTLVFASFSADALARADFSDPGRGGLRLLVPLSYVFRPGARSFTAGLGAGWGFAPERVGRKSSGYSGGLP